MSQGFSQEKKAKKKKKSKTQIIEEKGREEFKNLKYHSEDWWPVLCSRR